MGGEDVPVVGVEDAPGDAPEEDEEAGVDGAGVDGVETSPWPVDGGLSDSGDAGVGPAAGVTAAPSFSVLTALSSTGTRHRKDEVSRIPVSTQLPVLTQHRPWRVRRV